MARLVGAQVGAPADDDLSRVKHHTIEHSPGTANTRFVGMTNEGENLGVGGGYGGIHKGKRTRQLSALSET